MPSYPEKLYIVGLDDWFNNNSSNLENKSKAKGTINITTIYEFFRKQTHVKLGGSENLMKTILEKKSSEKIIVSSHLNSDKGSSPRYEEKYSSSKITTDLKSIKKNLFKRKEFTKFI